DFGADTGTAGTSTTSQVSFRSAVARDLVVGNVHLRNVSFMVLPDEGEPWVHLPSGKRGLLGVPVLAAFGSIRWSRDGTIEIGGKSNVPPTSAADIYFLNDHLTTDARFENRELPATLDSGAESTDLYAAFAKDFPSLVKTSGTKSTTQGIGAAGAEDFDSITLPQVTIRLGGLDVALRPA